MVLQAYMDESTDDESGLFVLAGYISSAEKWAQFSREWETLLPLSALQEDGRYRFKMSEMAQRRMGNVPAFLHVIRKYAEMSVSCVVDKTVLQRVLGRLTAHVSVEGGEQQIDIESIKKAWGDPYYFGFRALMDGFHQLRSEKSPLVPLSDEPVDFYFDEHSRKKVIRLIWDDYLRRRPVEQRSWFGSEPRFENDEKFLPLQAADCWAWWARRWAAEHGASDLTRGTYPFPTSGNKIFNLTIYADEETLRRTLARAIGQAIIQSAETQSHEG